MEMNKRNLYIGAAAAAIVVAGAGIFTGATLLAPKQTHVGETAATHAAELPGATGAASVEGEHADEEHVEGQIEMDAATIKASGIMIETTVGAAFRRRSRLKALSWRRQTGRPC